MLMQMVTENLPYPFALHFPPMGTEFNGYGRCSVTIKYRKQKQKLIQILAVFSAGDTISIETLIRN